MSRNVSDRFREVVYAQETDEVVICLLTVTHEDLGTPIYLSSDPTERLSDDPLIYGTNSRGNEYLFLPFEFTLPDDDSDSPPRVQLSMDNTDRSLVTILRSIATPADIKVELVLASDLSTIEIQLPALQLSDVTMDDGRISATLVADALINEPHPAQLFTPGSFPGLF
ncbi:MULTISPECIES: DUF1833 family protein [unclassified Rhizobium]|uniref:DUF1833 family protein n=1 Tax=unclassified Rhizobium TaxID=2613769 RepID=UPI00160E0112|nr:MULTISPECIES: DUF1833 family protein [unclassified Rhizobium]MBB3297906.1 hypothetical protein [Rhizobium sp. BK112]MBB4177599.1 hypothetical protein [Rhizobium sp. BK109]